MEIFTAVIVVAIISLIVGVVLAVASAVMSVKTDETVEKLTEALPGANCGACGFSGCSGYAQALASGEAKPGLCSPGGSETADRLSQILGIDSASLQQKVAIVHCQGSSDNTSKKYYYQGLSSCKAVASIYGGDGECGYGCIGLGDCKNACKFEGITICKGIAHINTDICTGCGACMKACPKGIISVVPKKTQAVNLCSNCDKGAETRKACSVGCIGCMMCEKACEFGAVKVVNFRAVVDPEKCTGCGACVEKCKLGCLQLREI